MTVRDGLHGAGEPFDLAGILRAGRDSTHRERVPQRVHRRVDGAGFRLVMRPAEHLPQVMLRRGGIVLSHMLRLIDDRQRPPKTRSKWARPAKNDTIETIIYGGRGVRRTASSSGVRQCPNSFVFITLIQAIRWVLTVKTFATVRRVSR